jgi:hypothetical protein
MGVLPPALEFIFQLQRKKSNEKIVREKKTFSTHNTHFFSFYFLFDFK